MENKTEDIIGVSPIVTGVLPTKPSLGNRVKVALALSIALIVCLTAALVGLGVSRKLRGGNNDTTEENALDTGNESDTDPPPHLAGLKTMPNVGFLLSGYDIMFGNPLPTSAFGVLTSDPGFRLPVFASDFSEGLTTQDLRYIVPSGLSVRSCTGTCSLSFTSSVIESEFEYSKRLGVKAKVSGGSKFFGAKFSASADYQRVSSGTSSSEETVTQSEASCCAYSGELPAFDLPDYHPTFLNGLMSLTEEYDEAVYRTFINAFGTHYVQKGFMGAVYGEQSIISSEARQSFESQSLDIRAAASASAFGITASASLQVESDKELARKFRQQNVRRSVFSHGAPPPADGKPTTWAQQTIASPAPISIDLQRLDSLPLPVSDAVMSNLSGVLDAYCTLLVEESVIGTCENPTEPPGCPTPNLQGILCQDIGKLDPVSCNGCCYKNTCFAFGAGFIPLTECRSAQCPF